MDNVELTATHVGSESIRQCWGKGRGCKFEPYLPPVQYFPPHCEPISSPHQCRESHQGPRLGFSCQYATQFILARSLFGVKYLAQMPGEGNSPRAGHPLHFPRPAASVASSPMAPEPCGRISPVTAVAHSHRVAGITGKKIASPIMISLLVLPRGLENF